MWLCTGTIKGKRTRLTFSCSLMLRLVLTGSLASGYLPKKFPATHHAQVHGGLVYLLRSEGKAMWPAESLSYSWRINITLNSMSITAVQYFPFFIFMWRLMRVCQLVCYVRLEVLPNIWRKKWTLLPFCLLPDMDLSLMLMVQYSTLFDLECFIFSAYF